MEDLTRRITQLERWRDTFIQNEVGGWRDWTPTITQSGSVTITIDEAKYMLLGGGKLVTLYAELTVTGSGTSGQGIVVGGLPTHIEPAKNGTYAIGSFFIVDSSVPIRYVGSVSPLPATVGFRFQSSGFASAAGVTPAFGLANGDTIGFSCFYRVD